MKIQIVKNRYLNSLLLLMLFSAVVHMVLLVIEVMATGNIHVLNYFTIVGLDRLVSIDFTSMVAGLVSAVVVVVMYAIILIWN